MTKIKKKQTVNTLSRKRRVKTCSRCKGKPNIEPIKVEGFTGTKCADCYEVVSYEKV